MQAGMQEFGRRQSRAAHPRPRPTCCTAAVSCRAASSSTAASSAACRSSSAAACCRDAASCERRLETSALRATTSAAATVAAVGGAGWTGAAAGGGTVAPADRSSAGHAASWPAALPKGPAVSSSAGPEEGLAAELRRAWDSASEARGVEPSGGKAASSTRAVGRCAWLPVLTAAGRRPQASPAGAGAAWGAACCCSACCCGCCWTAK